MHSWLDKERDKLAAHLFVVDALKLNVNDPFELLLVHGSLR